MSFFYQRLLRPLLYRLDPETSHRVAIAFLRRIQVVPFSRSVARRMFEYKNPRLVYTWKGLTFPNPVGLAAGADKNGAVPKMFEAIGMGFVEIGTVTPLAQPGNPKPRVFRLVKEQSLVNRLGFPSQGVLKVAGNLSRYRQRGIPLGINIGKNAATPLEQAHLDYESAFSSLYTHGDYFVVNVSSPNTLGLTSLQGAQALGALLEHLLPLRLKLANGRPPKPLLVKISPDLSQIQLADVIRVCLETGADGIVATNTTTDRTLRPEPARELEGGLSGRLLHKRSLETVAAARALAPDDFFIIGAGGIFNGEDALAMLKAGANVVQLYTGLVYRGPGIVKEINRTIMKNLKA